MSENLNIEKAEEMLNNLNDSFADIFGSFEPPSVPIGVKKISPTASLPSFSSEGATCADLRSSEDTVIFGGSTKIIKTGLILEIPRGWGGFIRSRSGLASRGLVVRGGIIDSDYRGEVGVILHNSTKTQFHVYAGDRIAQIDFRPVERVEFFEVEVVSDTERGEGGFGSTGHK